MNELIIEPNIISQINVDMANHYKMIPTGMSNEKLEIVTIDRPEIESVKEEIEFLTGFKVIITIADFETINKLLSKYYRKEVINKTTKSLQIEKSDFLETLLTEAKMLNSSDIHFEIFDDTARIRFRIDGQLIERYTIDKENYLELVNKIKIKSKLNITEKRLPQDGRITTESFDIRVSILPTLHGEKIVLRILGQDASNIDLKILGFNEIELNQYLESVKKPNGIILISGPTGSGKTTTLYATLKLLNDIKRNIVTVEDPIEYTLKGINQVQLKEDIGLTFATALKSFLRQDPDIIMLGEIRDTETALMAIRASLTGHLVLSTIHTNSAISTVSRLIDMGVPPYLISETLNLSLAQRLVRKLCDCKQKIEVNEKDFPVNFKIPYKINTIYKPHGCNECYYTGYKGRTAIYEMIPIDYENAMLIKNNTFFNKFNNEKNDKTLSRKAFDLLANGTTTLEEIYPILINY